MSCISCNNSKLILYENDSYLKLPIYYCRNCGLYTTGKSENEIRDKCNKIYENSYWDGRDGEWSLKSDYTDSNSQSKRRQWISQFAYCKPYFENKHDFFEIGCGAGQTIYWFEEMGFKVMGVEPDERNVKIINQKLKHGKCIAGFAEELDTNEEFDMIWMSHVLEHLVRPDLFLKKIKKNLRKGGIFFIEVPNCENINLLKSLIPTQPHTYHFSKKALINIATNAGYKIERCDFFRPAMPIEGIINKVIKKLFNVTNNIYPYYPKISTNNKNGIDLRIILKNT